MSTIKADAQNNNKAKSPVKITLRWLCILTIIAYMAYLPAQAATQQALMAQANTNSAFDRDMRDVMQKTDKTMAATPMTGDPDLDFIAMMIPHHQSAIDMAKVYLQYGKDPVLRQIAQDIVAKQQQEIKVLRDRQAVLQTGPNRT